jgi:hypothetical protein
LPHHAAFATTSNGEAMTNRSPCINTEGGRPNGRSSGAQRLDDVPNQRSGVAGRSGRDRIHEPLAEPTLIHWNGLRIPASMDGTQSTQRPVEPGETFTYRFTPADTPLPRAPRSRHSGRFDVVR